MLAGNTNAALAALAIERGIDLDACNAKLADIARFNAAPQVPLTAPPAPTWRERLHRLFAEE